MIWHSPIETRWRIQRAIQDGIPRVLRGVMTHDPFTEQASPSGLADLIGNSKVTVATSLSPRLHWDPAKGLPLRKMWLSDFHETHGYNYVQDDVSNLRGLRGHDGAQFGIKSIRTKLWVSGAGLITPLHYDPVETLHWVAKGSKRFHYMSPGLRDMNAYGWWTDAPFISQHSCIQAALGAACRSHLYFDIEVKAGDLLYLPAYWWHEVESRGDYNVSLNYVWWANWRRNLWHWPQLARTLPHLRRQLKKVRAAKLG